MPKAIGAVTLGLLLAAASSARGADSSIGAGTTGTVGSAGYGRFSMYGDGLWRTRSVDPYAWTEFSSDNFINEFTLAGGVWKDLLEDLRIKGGGGFVAGKIKGTNDSSTSLLVETGIERFFERRILGAEYRLISGSIVPSTALQPAEQQVQSRGQGGRDQAETVVAAPQHFNYNELSGYAKLPTGRYIAGLRLTVGLPDYARSIFDETLSLKIPAWKALSVTPAVTLEQGPASNIYFSLSLYYIFW